MIPILKATAKAVFARLPFWLQIHLARGNPSAAFYIRKSPARTLIIDYYLKKYQVEIDSSVDIQRRMLSGKYEEDTLAIVQRLVRPGDTCIDIGANVGAITIALADRVGSSGRVEAFEPGSVFFNRLKKNLSLNPELEKIVHIHQVALADKRGELPWQESKVYTGTASMYSGVHEPTAPTLRLPVARLDGYLPIQNLKQIHFIKIDVDGLEREILKGSEGLLRQFHPTLYVETTLWNSEMKEAAKEIEQYLHGLGYELYKVLNQNGDLAPTRYPDFSMNTVAIHPERKG